MTQTAQPSNGALLKRDSNYFTPASFETSVRSALDVSDKYVWIRAEQPRWWAGEQLPLAYIEALRKVKAPKQ